MPVPPPAGAPRGRASAIGSIRALIDSARRAA